MLAKVERVDTVDSKPYTIDVDNMEVQTDLYLKLQLPGLSGFFRIDQLDDNASKVRQEEVIRIIEDIKEMGVVKFSGLEQSDMQHKVEELLRYVVACDNELCGQTLI